MTPLGLLGHKTSTQPNLNKFFAYPWVQNKSYVEKIFCYCYPKSWNIQCGYSLRMASQRQFQWVLTDMFHYKNMSPLNTLGKNFSKRHFEMFLAHLSTKCSRWAIVIDLCPSPIAHACVCLSSTCALNNFSSKTLYWIWNNFTEMFFGWPSTKISQTIPLCWTKWQPELKQ